MFKKKIILIFACVFLLSIMFVSAKPPILKTVQTGSLEIIAPTYDEIPLNTRLDIYWHVYNTTRLLMAIEDQAVLLTCNYHLYSKNDYGEHIFIVNNAGMNENGRDFEVQLNETNFTTAGNYCHLIECNTSTQAGAIERCFLVTESGVEMDESRSITSGVLLFVLIFFFLFTILGLIFVQEYGGKFALYWISHLLLTLILFVSWQLGVEGLLMGTALVGIFRILFWVILVGIFPMIILSIAWIFYVHTMNEHFKALIEKGENPETAFSLAKKKTRGNR